MDRVVGKLLIASPALADYFQRAVILVLAHGDEGSMGVVLNRPSEMPVSEALPALAEVAEPGELVYFGGPVSTDSVVALGDFEDTSEAAAKIVGSLGVVDPDRPRAALRRMRAFAGYSGWAPGQLEFELEAAAWIVEPAQVEDAFRNEDLWAVVLKRKGGAYSLLARMPTDPSLN
jgi:putative transcriptional regulator